MRSLLVTGAAGLAAVGVAVAAFAWPANASPPVLQPNGGGAACPGSCVQDGSGTGIQHRGAAMRHGPGVGRGAGTGMVAGSVTAATGTLTSAQRTTLAAMAEEEKLAHDAYAALARRFSSLRQFARISVSESRHLAAIRTLMTRYGVADPTAGKAEGRFASPSVQTLYDDYLRRATTPNSALAVGVAIEKQDIADLTRALSGLTAPDVKQVYTNLRVASQRHLAAFGG